MHPENESDHDDDDPPSLVKRFDEICFSIGDCDAIEIVKKDTDESSSSICYFELQEHSKTLACQVYHRYCPDYVLIDCQGWVAAEAIATLACMRIHVPFVPVSCYDQHRPGRLRRVADLLSQSKTKGKNQNASVVAVTVCDNDQDPILSVFQQAGVHQILYLDAMTGSLREQLNVPDTLPDWTTKETSDDLYVLFTSGTSTQTPKAVVGSHSATYRRIYWFLDKFPSSPRIGRRSKLTFVDGVNELWTSLLDQDSILVTVPPNELQSRGIVSIYSKCTQLLMLPSQLNQMLLLPKSPSLQRVLVSGEVCSSALVTKFCSVYESCELLNLYGQTESTGDVCCAILGASKEVAAIDNCVAIGAPILDSIQIVLGENSEMILQGAGQLANGYLTSGDNDKSPFSSFKTGDIGFCTNGVWYVKGRRDDVVKVNGIWTSPIEIETAFCKAYNVHRTVVAVFVEGRDTKVKTSYLLCPDERVCQAFSRTNMHEQHGFPWNIIPSNVFFWHKLPTSSGGAAKINREACRKIVYNHLDQEKNSLEPKQRSNLAKKADHPTFLSLAARALGIKEAALDVSKSFVELGGDSATSITLLYLMRTLDGINCNDYTSTDLLNAESLQTFQARLSGEVPSSKRHKPSSPPRLKFKPQSVVRHSKQHRSISLKACVDSTPLVVDDKYIYVACQGGIIVKCDREGSIIDYTQLHGWLVQADLLYLKDQSIIIACAYSLEGKGIVVALSTDLKTDVWKQVMDGTIKTSPVLNRNDLWVQAGDTVCVLNVMTGANERAIQFKLPHHSIAKPLIFQKDKSQYIAYASSEFESCLMIVDGNGNIQKELEYEIGPVHKDLCKLDNEMAYIADSYGALHLIDLAAKAIKVTYRLSSNPLSPPLLIGSQTCVVGGYDGILRCVNETGIIWECHVGAAVYSKPVMLRSSVRTIIVSTTAGDLVAIDAAAGKIQWRDHIPAEIWSDLEVAFNDIIVFGARDSRLHLYSKQHLDTTVW